MLKTSHISASGTAPRRATSPKTGGTGSGASIAKPTARPEAQQVAHAAAGDVREAAHGDVRAQQLEHRAHVDHGRLEQRVGDARAAELGRAVVERQAALVEQRAARERVAVGVQAARREADERVAGRDGVAGHDRVERDGADRGAAEVEAVRRRVAADELGQHGELAAGDLDARRLRADPQALGDPRQRVRVGLLDGEVVEHRDRLGADADRRR